MKTILLALIFVGTGIYSGWSNANAVVNCKNSYDTEAGIAVLPCVEVQPGQWYWVRMQHQAGLNFSVTQAAKYLSGTPPVSLVQSRILGSQSSESQQWLFLELNMDVTTVDTIYPVFEVTKVPGETAENHGRIEITTFALSPDIGPPGLVIADKATIGKAMLLYPGTYDIYVNGELKKTVEVPSPDNQSP